MGCIVMRILQPNHEKKKCWKGALFWNWKGNLSWSEGTPCRCSPPQLGCLRVCPPWAHRSYATDSKSVVRFYAWMQLCECPVWHYPPDLHIAGAFLHGLLHSSSIALPPPCLTNSPCDLFWKSSITWMISPQLCVLLVIAYSLWLSMKKTTCWVPNFLRSCSLNFNTYVYVYFVTCT